MSQKEYGCFYCLGKSIEYNGFCDQCQRPIDISVDLLTLKLPDYRIEKVIGRGFYGWTLLAEFQRQWYAVKVVPKKRLQGRSITDQEATALAACARHPNIAGFWCQLNADLVINSEQIPLLALIFEFIPNAKTLRAFNADPPSVFSRVDAYGIIKGIAAGLARMETHDLWHDDLHDDNILVREIDEDEGGSERFQSKLIDFGSAKPRKPDQEEKEKNDYSRLGDHIYDVINAFERVNDGRISPADRAFASKMRGIAHNLKDSDVSRRNLKPAEVIAKLRACLDDSTTGFLYPTFNEMREHRRVSFEEPLANSNALYLANQDIPILFRDPLNWERQLGKTETVCVVGPRGCGKTMLLRFLSISSAARPRTGEDSPSTVAQRLEGMGHIGFMVSVADVRGPFIRSGFTDLLKDSKTLAGDFCREYFNTRFAFEVLRNILWLQTEKLITVPQDDLNLIANCIDSILGNTKVNTSLQDFENIVERIDRKTMQLSNLGIGSAYSPTAMASDDVLARISRALKSTHWARTKEIWFLIDDYSVTVLPLIAQEAYNTVVFRASQTVRIKVSSEGAGPILTDTLGRKYREGRELSKVNLGEVYFQCSESDGVKFFESILQARFEATGKGSIEQLRVILMEHEHAGNFGDYIRRKDRPGNAEFYGFEMLCRLCSGDVSIILELLHVLVAKESWSLDAEPISAHRQDRVVKKFAQRQLAQIRNIPDYGTHLYVFAEQIGQLIKHYLLQKTQAPDERIRIEIEGDGELSQKAQKIEDALFRYSILIDLGAGKSKSGTPTRKAIFRRLFAPCFPFSPSRNGCIAVPIKQYEAWLLDPKRILADKNVKRSSRPKKQQNKNGIRDDLFRP